jgi:CheY-like chemotaxis protein
MKKILLIEDEQILHLNVLNLLIENGFNTLITESSEMGLFVAREIVPDAILCNVNNPKLDAYKMLKQFRHDPVTATIPFIFITAQTTKAEVSIRQQQEADIYLTQPFTSKELLGAIANLLESECRSMQSCL